MSHSNYFIKEGYTENPPITFQELDPTEYWTQERIKSSHEYQFHAYELARKLFVEKRFSSLVDIGAGPGTKLQHFFRGLSSRTVLIDQPGMGEVVKKHCPIADEYIGLNLESEELNSEERFDLVICSDVIEHLENPSNLLQLLKRLLAPSGLIVLSTPERDMLNGSDNLRSPNNVHVREWNENELSLYLRSEGFNIIEHVCLPAKREYGLLYHLAKRVAYKKIRRSRWFSCQVAVLNC